MFAPCLSRCLPATLLILTASLGCSSSSPVSPSSPPEQPAVTSVFPLTGSTAGGTSVTIGGTGFANGATVTLNGHAARVVSVASRVISAVTPPTPLGGAADVVVTNPDGASGRLPGGFTYILMERPAITSVSAEPGSTLGGGAFTIAGTGFQPGARASFGGAAVAASLVQGDLRGSTPPHAAGTVDVTVTNPDGQLDTFIGGYSYVEPGSLDFNGTWEGFGTEGETTLKFTVRDNALTGISCGPAPDATPILTIAVSPPLPVSNGAVTFSGSDGAFTGRIVTARSASGTLRFDRCFAGLAFWFAVKR